MKHITIPLALLLVLVEPAGVFAQPRVIGDLSQGALLGQIRDTAQLQRDFNAHYALLAQASAKLGLQPADFEEISDDVAHGGMRYVEIPRHLTRMSGQRAGRAFVVRDVVIPARTYGWEVDLQRPTEIVRVFMPNRCGNLSYLIVPRSQQVAAAPTRRVPLPAVVTAAPMASGMTTPAPVAIVTAVPIVTPAPPPAAHHFALLPVLAIALIGVAFMHGGGGSLPTAPIGVVAVPTPVPVHTICPAAPAIHH